MKMVETGYVDAEVKKRLTGELGSVVKAAANSAADVKVLHSDTIQAVCNVLEAIFIHGLRDPFFVKGSRYAKYPEPNFWPFVSKLSHRNIRSQIASLNQIRSEVGRARAWIRTVLNEGVIEHYILALSRDKTSICQFYKEGAYLRDAELVDILLSYIKAISKVKLNAPVNSSLLNGWTPTPLIFAGLISGITHSSKLYEQRKREGSLVEMDDIPEDDIPLGVSALEYEGLEGNCAELLMQQAFPSASTSLNKSLNSCGRRTPRGLLSSEDEDTSSVYSHPSMVVDTRLQRFPKFRRDSQTSTISTPNPTEEAGGAPQIEGEVFSDSGIALESESTKVVIYRQGRMGRLSPLTRPQCTSSPVNSLVDFSSQTLTETAVQTDQQQNQDAENASVVESEDNRKDVQVNIVETCREERQISGVSAQIEMELVMEKTLVVSSLQQDVHVAENSSKLDEKNMSRNEELVISDDTAAVSSISRDYELNGGECKSLGDELFNALVTDTSGSCFSPSGNSLFGREWGPPSPLLEATESDSTHFETFDTVLRKALTSGNKQEAAPEMVVRNRLDSDQFAATVNLSSDELEVAQSSIQERADEVSMLHVAVSVRPAADMSSHDCEDYMMVDSASNSEEWAISSERVSLLSTFAQEGGLDAQDFQCPSCRRNIGITYGRFKTCYFDGKYYCEECQKKDEIVIPARLIHSWDLRPRPVSRASKSFVEHVADRPLIRLDQINPSLYEAIPEMSEVHTLRDKLSLVAMYLLTCKESIAEDLRRRVWPKEYLFNDIHLFSVNDLLNAASGVMQKHLQAIIAYAVKHVQQCRLCVQKGFICEICNHSQIIYPFQVETTFRCIKCFSVYHKGCMNGRPCPKCARRELYLKEAGSSTDQLLNNLLLDDV